MARTPSRSRALAATATGLFLAATNFSVVVAEPSAAYAAYAASGNTPVAIASTPTPAPPSGSARFNDPGRARQYALDMLRAEDTTAALTRAGDNTASYVVAVIDTGVDATQPDLRGRVLPGADFVNDNADPAGAGTVDPNGHGTHVAGIISAISNNSLDVAGLTDAKILPVRVLGADGHGRSGAVAQGIEWAVAHGANVINLSVAGEYDPVYDSAVRYARDHGVIVVAAAGNNGATDDAPMWPASSSGAVSVGSVERDGSVSGFSNHSSNVALVAPGDGILSLCASHLDPATSDCAPGKTRYMSGTSQATPGVAAAFVTAWAAHPALSSDQLISLVESTSTKIATLGNNAESARDSHYYGHGLVNPYAAVTDTAFNSLTGSLTRLAGADRIGTAIAVSQKGYAAGAAQAVVLTRDDDYADALAGAPLAVAENGPLLMTPTAKLDPRDLAEIQRVLAPGGTVYVLGGTASISESTATTLSTAGYALERLAGSDRYETAVKIAAALGNPATVLLASGTNFPDALSAGDAAASRHGALLLTAGAVLPAATRDYLAAHPGPLFAIGGPAAQADAAAQPVVGVDRYDTAARVAQKFFPSPGAAGIASGLTFPDALSAGAALARLNAPLLLASLDTVPGPVSSYIGAVRPGAVYLYGNVLPDVRSSA